jgi:hypothetical protein
MNLVARSSAVFVSIFVVTVDCPRCPAAFAELADKTDIVPLWIDRPKVAVP